jgi:hypothetical protein
VPVPDAVIVPTISIRFGDVAETLTAEVCVVSEASDWVPQFAAVPDSERHANLLCTEAAADPPVVNVPNVTLAVLVFACINKRMRYRYSLPLVIVSATSNVSVVVDDVAIDD